MTTSTPSIASRDIANLLHPYTNLRKHEMQGPLVIVRGSGVTVFDDNGKEYIEALAGLAHSGPPALRPEFARLVREARLDGFGPAVQAMRDRLADPVVDLVAAGLALNDRLGGRNVSQVLDRLAHATRVAIVVRALDDGGAELLRH